MPRLSRSEQAVQIAIVDYLRLNGFLFAVPDAGVNVNNIRTQSILKKMGRSAGVSDIIVFIPAGTLCVEVKRPEKREYNFKTGHFVISERKGSQSIDQKNFERRINRITGHHYIVATSVDDVINFIKKNNIKPE